MIISHLISKFNIFNELFFLLFKLNFFWLKLKSNTFKNEPYLLGFDCVLDAKMALGEGTGAVMLFPLLDMALAVYNNRTTFDDLKMEEYTRF